MEYILSALISFAVGILVMYLAEESHRIAKWLICVAVQQYSEPERSRYREEWLFHLEQCVGPVDMVRHGVGCIIAGAKDGSRLRNAAVSRIIIFEMVMSVRCARLAFRNSEREFSRFDRMLGKPLGMAVGVMPFVIYHASVSLKISIYFLNNYRNSASFINSSDAAVIECISTVDSMIEKSTETLRTMQQSAARMRSVRRDYYATRFAQLASGLPRRIRRWFR